MHFGCSSLFRRPWSRRNTWIPDERRCLNRSEALYKFSAAISGIWMDGMVQIDCRLRRDRLWAAAPTWASVFIRLKPFDSVGSSLRLLVSAPYSAMIVKLIFLLDSRFGAVCLSVLVAIVGFVFLEKIACNCGHFVFNFSCWNLTELGLPGSFPYSLSFILFIYFL